MDAQKSALALAAFGATALLGTGIIHKILKGKGYSEFKAHHVIILGALGLGVGYMVYQAAPATPVITPTPPKPAPTCTTN